MCENGATIMGGDFESPGITIQMTPITPSENIQIFATHKGLAPLMKQKWSYTYLIAKISNTHETG